jgi:ADP-ribosylglycohydrolase
MAMTDDASWFAEVDNAHRTPSFPPSGPDGGANPTWAERFRGALLGGAVGDALGAGVRHRTTMEIQRRFGPQGVLDYLPIFGRRGACTELTQLTVFTLEALLRAKAVNGDSADWLPTPIVRTNLLRWLYTQGVPWDYAMSGYLETHSEPSGWLLERPELFSTRNPIGGAMAGLGKLAARPPVNAAYDPRYGPAVQPGFTDCVVWAAPTMVWGASGELVFAAGADVAKMLTDDLDVHAAAGLQAEVLGRIIRGEADLWHAVSMADARSVHPAAAAVRRTVHAAMFLTRSGRRPEPIELDVEFDTERRPGELGTALAAVSATDNYADAVLLAVNQSADSSVTGALAGQIAGAVHGPEAIPARWLQELELLEVIETLCADAAEAFAPPPPPPPLPKWAQRYVSAPERSFSGPLELSPADPATTVDSFIAEPLPEPVGSEDVPDAELLADDSESPLLATETTMVIEPAAGPEDPVTEPAELEMSPVDEELVLPEPLPVGEDPELIHTEDPDSALSAEEEAPNHGTGDEQAADPVLDPSPTPAGVVAPDADAASEPELASAPLEAGFSHQSAETEPPRGNGVEPAGHALVEGPDYTAPSLTERVLGCFLGGALGDALGSDLEFISADEISARFGPDGPRGLREAYGVHGAITDDTQMTLFTAEGLIRGSVAHRTHGVDDPVPELQLAYQRWLYTQGVEWQQAAGAFLADYPEPDGWLVGVRGLFSTRAPGKTVFRALAGFGEGKPAGSVSERINDSKGCGGVMRVAPAALYSTDPATVFELAARTAALTHGHPSGYLSAGALAVIVQQALLGQELDDGVWLALQVLETWEAHEETTTMLKVAVDLASNGVPTPEQVESTLGGGWVGEQALAIAVCAALVGGDDVELALRVAVHHGGDSDSTGAICGNIIGALIGIGGVPMDWLVELELREVIEQVALDCVAEFGVGEFLPGRAISEGEPAHGQPIDEDWSRRYPVRPLWSDRRDVEQVDQGDVDQGEPPTMLLPALTVQNLAHGPGHPASEPLRETPQSLLTREGPEPAVTESLDFADIQALPEPSREFGEEPAEKQESDTGPREAVWPQRETRGSDSDFLRTDSRAPKPAPRRINGVVSNYRED